MSTSPVATIIVLSDRRYWPTILEAWQAGRPARCPQGHNIDEWRASARRLAADLSTPVRTSLAADGAFAVANGGYPPGMVDQIERRNWRLQTVRAAFT